MKSIFICKTLYEKSIYRPNFMYKSIYKNIFKFIKFIKFHASLKVDWITDRLSLMSSKF